MTIKERKADAREYLRRMKVVETEVGDHWIRFECGCRIARGTTPTGSKPIDPCAKHAAALVTGE